MGDNVSVLQRVQDVINFFVNQKDDKGLDLVLDALNNASDYVSSVTKMESQIKIQRFRMETMDYQELVMSLDRRRRIAHDALLSTCAILNRYFRKTYPEKFPLGGIFGLPKERLENFDRHVAADWASEVVQEIFKNRQIRRSCNDITKDIDLQNLVSMVL
jgi:hypothetical protein